jgi:hypothetical protein
MNTFELKTTEDGTQFLEMTDVNGQVWGVPFDPANSDYQTYLAQLPAEKPKK